MQKWNAGFSDYAPFGRGAAPAGRTAYVNGRYLPHGEAGVHIEDRGLQLADSVYEVCNVRGGKMLDLEEHLDRLERSLGIIHMAMPMGRAALKHVMAEIVRRNRVAQGLIYLQVTRGAVRRDHAIPDHPPRPSLVITARSTPDSAARKFETGIKAITRPDERWARCDIKTTQLLPNLLARTAAKRAGAGEALLVDRDGFITEAAGANLWIIDAAGDVVTRNLGTDILPGVTRRVVMEAAAAEGLAVTERKFTLAEALAAREAFLTSANGAAVPVVEIDGRAISDGKPGPVGRRIRALYLSRAEGKAR
jgi:D-alanine transaminase